MYISPLGDLVRQHNVSYHMYADDTQRYLSFRSSDHESIEVAKSSIEQCVLVIPPILKQLQCLPIDHVTPILKLLQWLPIVRQLEVRDATMVFKCLNGLAPPYLCQRFKARSEVHNRTLGIGTAYIYHAVGRLQVSARLPSEAKGCGIVSRTSFSLSLI